LAEDLQRRMVDNLTGVSRRVGAADSFAPIEWLRDQGRHGGGVRFAAAAGPMFNRASVNVSAVHYDDVPAKRLSSATALSTIIHPQHPLAPSFHMHISWTEMRDGSGYWRVMADLNPSIPNDSDTSVFRDALRGAAPQLYERAATEGDRYFFIPALQRHRGVAHYYLEGHNSGSFEDDERFARKLGETAADTYAGIVEGALTGADAPTAEQTRQQLEYHTVYLLQVLTLDRGTTSGLLVHDQNDIGILGSLPARVDGALLRSWADRLSPPQDELLREIAAALPDKSPAPVSDQTRGILARLVRAHYRAHPEALSMQARGSVVPPTVANHGDRR
jgi:coproporphyrinogen III oxidase